MLYFQDTEEVELGKTGIDGFQLLVVNQEGIQFPARLPWVNLGEGTFGVFKSHSGDDSIKHP
jgi:hypothetical protein